MALNVYTAAIINDQIEILSKMEPINDPVDAKFYDRIVQGIYASFDDCGVSEHEADEYISRFFRRLATCVTSNQKAAL